MSFARTMAAVSVTGTALGLGFLSMASAPASAATAGGTATAATAVASTIPITISNPAPAVAPVVVSSCGTGSGPAYTRPHQFDLSCDGSDSLLRLRWTSWAATGASGHGEEGINDCTPDCANGKFRYYPVHVDLRGTAPVKGHPGEVRYTHYTLRYAHGGPDGAISRTGSL